MTTLTLDHVSFEIAGKTVLCDANVSFKTGELTAIIGPNGAGKSTLLACALGLKSPTAGEVRLNGAPLVDHPATQRARILSYLPQSRPLAWPLRVRDVIALGRFAYGTSLSRPDEKSLAAINAAAADCGLTEYLDRHTDTLSGGELARVHCARAFASEAPLILADEPVTALDLKHQFQIMSILKQYAAQNRGAVVVMHDLALAAEFADRLIWMAEGRIIADGPVSETMTPDKVRDVFDVTDDVLKFSGVPLTG